MAPASCRRRLRRPVRILVHREPMLPPRLLLVLLLAAAWRVEAQPSSPPPGDIPDNYSVKVNPALVSLLIAFVCGFFLLGFFSVYLRRWAEDSAAAAAARRGARIDGGEISGDNRRTGLDRAVLETFPTMAYARAKEMRSGKEAMECAVCLSEFSDDDILRLIPGCCHVFHVDCVDVWLESHVTCPVCRADMSNPSEPAANSRAPEGTTGDDDSAEEEEAASVRHEDEDLETGLGAPVPEAPAKRSHSTGHEAPPGVPEDRYTLRLPEHVRMELLEAGRLRRAASLGVPSGGDAGGRRGGYRGGAGAGRSGRWSFLLRTFSVGRRPEVAPVPARSSSEKRIFPSKGAPTSSASVGDGNVECESGSGKSEEGNSSSEAV